MTRVRRFHTFSFDARTGDLSRRCGRAHRGAERAVSRQLESDVPLGALLGRIDSSLVAAFASRSNEDLLTFKCRCPTQPTTRPGRLSRSRERSVGAHHVATRGAGRDVGRGHGHPPTGRPPFADTSIFAVDAMARDASPRDGRARGRRGREGFGGYDAYWQLGWVARLQRLPAPLQRAMASLASPLARTSACSHRSVDVHATSPPLTTSHSWRRSSRG